MQKSNSVVKFYDKYPYPNFEIKSVGDLEGLKFQRFITELVKTHSKGKKVLEVGTGTGELAMLLAKNGFEVTAYDISEKSLEIARVKTRRFGLKGKFINKDVLEVTGSNNFDVVIANGILHHTKNPFLGLKNISNLTCTNGLVITVFYNKYGSFPRLLLATIFNLIPGDLSGRIKVVRKLTLGRYADKSDSVIADTFFHPYESHHSLGEVLKWHDRVGLRVEKVFPPTDIKSYSILIINTLKMGDIHNTIIDIYNAKNTISKLNHISKFRLIFFQFIWMISTKGNVFVVVSKRN